MKKETSKEIRLAIVDDNPINRRTVEDKLQSFDDVKIIFEAINGEDFFNKLDALPKDELPNIVLMDLEMPVLDGISTISLASIKYPEMKFIVLTIFEDNDKIFEAIKAGASGYLLKEDRAVNILESLRNALEFDGIPMSPAIARRAMRLLSGDTSISSTPQDKTEYLLTEREIEILKEIVKGSSHSEIGERLFISPNTVRTHMNNIYKKLHLNSRSQIINWAYKNNLM